MRVINPIKDLTQGGGVAVAPQPDNKGYTQPVQPVAPMVQGQTGAIKPLQLQLPQAQSVQAIGDSNQKGYTVQPVAPVTDAPTPTMQQRAVTLNATPPAVMTAERTAPSTAPAPAISLPRVAPATQSVQPMPSVQPRPQPVVQQAPMQTTPSTINNISEQLKAAQRAKLLAGFEQQFKQTEGRLAQERGELGESALKRRSQIAIEDAMARRAQENMAATVGLGASGFAQQSDIAQNIATQGRIGESESLLAKGQADVGRRLSEAQMQRDFGIAQGEADLGIREMEFQLERQLTKERDDREERLMREGWSREDARMIAQQEFQQKMQQMSMQFESAQRAEERAFQQSMQNTAWAREDVLREQSNKRQDQLMAQGYAREDAMRQADREYQAALRAEETKRQDQLIAQGYSREDALRQMSWERDDRLRAEANKREDELIARGYAREDARTLAQREYQEKLTAQQTATQREQDTFNQYIDTISRFGDFQAEINKLKSADPNDPRIPYLEAARQQKVQGQESQAQKEYLATIDRFSTQPGGFMAEIERIKKTPSKDDDWALPYLEEARASKIVNQKAEEEKQQQAQAKAAETQRAKIVSVAKSKIDDYIPLNAEEAAAMGVPVGYVKPKPATKGKTPGKPQDPNKWITITP